MASVKKQLLSKPCLILVMGVAGSGKTTLANEILRRLWAVYLDNNHIADAFFPNTRSGRHYEKLRPRFYEALYRIAEENLRTGSSVLLDVPHVKEMQTPKWRRFIKRLAWRTKSRVVIIRCYCTENVARLRLQSRNERRDRSKLKYWREFLSAQPLNVAIPFPHLDIDTEKHLSANTSAALRYILKHGGRAHRPESGRQKHFST